MGAPQLAQTMPPRQLYHQAPHGLEAARGAAHDVARIRRPRTEARGALQALDTQPIAPASAAPKNLTVTSRRPEVNRLEHAPSRRQA
eukprot:1429426-Pyramimonas_sp.AAC.1